METINGVEHTTRYSYDNENRPIETTYNYLAKGKNVIENLRYDEYGRLKWVDIGEAEIGKTKTMIFDTLIGYHDGDSGDSPTSRLHGIWHLSTIYHALVSSYDYDAQGNITRSSLYVAHECDYDPYFDTLIRQGYSYYHYDTANQLVREDNTWLGKTFVWTYDDAGNITSRKEYAYTDRNSEVTGTPTATYTYTYGDSDWGDLLTAYNGVARTYDEVGNLLTDGTWTYSWRNGRELASMTDGTTTWNYTYDANGMRTSRTNGSTTYNYVYNGSQLVQMTVGNDTLYFTYGALGPATVTWNGTTYYYGLNGQGDVIGIYDNTGYVVVTYNWDTAWGYNPMPEGLLASTLGALNPLRYRSYVYDSETGYYYLQSRYYDPEIGRFINADGLIATGQGMLGNNMFAYCGNNPVNRADPAGQLWGELWNAFTQTIQQSRGYFAVAAGITQVDSPALGPADAIGAVMAISGLFACATIAVRTTISVKPTVDIFSKTEEKAEAIAITKEPRKPVIFPLNPNDFNPVGLLKIPRPGTKNGAFISWVHPVTHVEVFRWDENPNYPNGPHYHIKGKGHYYPGMLVPEYYASTYFPFQ